MSRAPARAAAVGASVLQLFTKPVHRWAEPTLSPDQARAFRGERAAAGLVVAGAHDAYLINLATPDRALFRRSRASFEAELRRVAALGLDFVVTHPGNATGGDREDALRRNADAIVESMTRVPGDYRVLLEGTAGQGTALGARFEELARMLEAVPGDLAARVGVCLDTAHLWAAGYDLVKRYEGVLEAFDAVVGLPRLGLLHLNDSKAKLGGRLDRHEHIGKGALGDGPFRRILNDPRLAGVPKVIETPKGDDPVRWDRRNLRRLRSFVEAGRWASRPGGARGRAED